MHGLKYGNDELLILSLGPIEKSPLRRMFEVNFPDGTKDSANLAVQRLGHGHARSKEHNRNGRQPRQVALDRFDRKHRTATLRMPSWRLLAVFGFAGERHLPRPSAIEEFCRFRGPQNFGCVHVDDQLAVRFTAGSKDGDDSVDIWDEHQTKGIPLACENTKPFRFQVCFRRKAVTGFRTAHVCPFHEQAIDIVGDVRNDFGRRLAFGHVLENRHCKTVDYLRFQLEKRSCHRRSDLPRKE